MSLPCVLLQVSDCTQLPLMHATMLPTAVPTAVLGLTMSAMGSLRRAPSQKPGTPVGGASCSAWPAAGDTGNCPHRHARPTTQTGLLTSRSLACLKGSLVLSLACNRGNSSHPQERGPGKGGDRYAWRLLRISLAQNHCETFLHDHDVAPSSCLEQAVSIQVLILKQSLLASFGLID